MCNVFGSMLTPVARKDHRCEWCYERIARGERHHQFKGQWNGEWQNWRMHAECYAVYSTTVDCDEGFAPGEGERPERLKHDR